MSNNFMKFQSITER